jgi:hypothetical protein
LSGSQQHENPGQKSLPGDFGDDPRNQRPRKSPVEFERRITDGILALASAQDLLVSSDWRGATLSELLMAQVKPFGAEHSIVVSGLAFFFNMHLYRVDPKHGKPNDEYQAVEVVG